MKKLIDKLKIEWSIPKKANHRGEETFFRFVCLFSDKSTDIDTTLPPNFRSFLLESDGAVLFKDVDYGQWGLKICSYDELNNMNSYTRTWKENLLSSDLVVAEFLGDLDLLVVSCAEEDFGQVIIAIPIYQRKDWYFLKMNFEEFLEKYIENEGDKFWEK